MNEEKTVLEVLKETVAMLGNLRIPMSEMENIGFPIGRSINNIRLCVDAIERNEAQNKQKEADGVTMTGETADAPEGTEETDA